MKRKYDTFTLPQYVKRWLGPPVTMTRTSKGVYVFEGANTKKIVEADTAADARKVIRDMARYSNCLKDRRLRGAKRFVPMNEHNGKKHFFYASSVATWREADDLEWLIASMKRENLPFNLWMVPGDRHTIEYKIEYYAPKVEGAVWMGSYLFEDH